MNDIKLIASDMDHTLLTEKGELPPDLDQYIDALDDAGIVFAAASGRPVSTLANMFHNHLDHMLLIGDNGAVISQNGNLIAKNILPSDDIREMVKFSLEETSAHPIICDFNGAVASNIDTVFDQNYRQFYHDLRFSEQIKTWDGEADKVAFYLPNNDSQVVFDEYLYPMYGDKYSVVVSDKCWIDIMPKNINKGNALAKVSDYFGIESTQMMAFGDTFNDAEMLQYVEHSYLMGNADKEMEQFAKYRTGTNDEYGVLQILDKVLA